MVSATYEFNVVQRDNDSPQLSIKQCKMNELLQAFAKHDVPIELSDCVMLVEHSSENGVRHHQKPFGDLLPWERLEGYEIKFEREGGAVNVGIRENVLCQSANKYTTRIECSIIFDGDERQEGLYEGSRNALKYYFKDSKRE